MKRRWMVWLWALLSLGPTVLSGAADEPLEARWAAFEESLGRLRKARRLEDAVRLCEAELRKLDPESTAAVARLSGLLADCFMEASRFRDAEGPARQAVAILSVNGRDRKAVIEARLRLPPILVYGKSDSPAAEKELREIEKLLPEGDEVLLAKWLAAWGITMFSQQRISEAESAYRRAIALAEKEAFGDERFPLDAKAELTWVLSSAGRPDEALELYKSVFETRRVRFGLADDQTLTAMNNIADQYLAVGRWAEAEALWQECVELRRAYFSPHDFNRNMPALNLANLYAMRGRLEAGLELVRDVYENFRVSRGPDDPQTLLPMMNLCRHLVLNRKLDEAESLLMELGRLYSAQNEGKESGRQKSLLAQIALDRGRPEVAASHYQDFLRIAQGDRNLSGRPKAEALAGLAKVLRLQGRIEEALALLVEAKVEFPPGPKNDHPSSINLQSAYGRALAEAGRLEEAGAELAQALARIEHVRAGVSGPELDRALHADALGLASTAAELSAVLIRQGQIAEAFRAGERGRSRALLDLLERAGFDLKAEAAARGDDRRLGELHTFFSAEQKAIAKLREAENDLVRLQRPQGEGEIATQAQLAAAAAKIEKAREEVLRFQRHVDESLRYWRRDAEPASLEALQAALEPNEWLLSFVSGEDTISLVALGAGEGAMHGAVVVQGRGAMAEFAEWVREYRTWLLEPGAPGTGNRSIKDRDLLSRASRIQATLLPPAARERLLNAKRWVVIPPGGLSGIPFEALPVAAGDKIETTRFLVDSAPAISYASSASTFLDRRKKSQATRRQRSADAPWTALIVAEPTFGRHPGAARPERSGVLVFSVDREGAAQAAGLMPGDILLSIDGNPVLDAETLSAFEVRLAETQKNQPGPMQFTLGVVAGSRPRELTIKLPKTAKSLGLRLWPGDVEAGLRILAASGGTPVAPLPLRLSAADEARLFGRGLEEPIAGAAFEAERIAETIAANGGQATLLKGERASVPELFRNAAGRRMVHLATHGFGGSAARPLDACLVLARPESLGVEDSGVLSLQDLLRAWRGKLAEADLVVLSACESSVGRPSEGGDTIALPWGFQYAGASSVVASLWRTRDWATSLLMARFYENLLARKQPKAEALREARLWLRGLLRKDVEALIRNGSRGDESALETVRGLRLEKDVSESTSFYGHPYSWAPFILIGENQ